MLIDANVILSQNLIFGMKSCSERLGNAVEVVRGGCEARDVA